MENKFYNNKIQHVINIHFINMFETIILTLIKNKAIISSSFFLNLPVNEHALHKKANNSLKDGFHPLIVVVFIEI